MKIEANRYIVAMITNEQDLIPLNCGRVYGRVAAQMRAEELQETCKEELKALDAYRFVAYSLINEEEY